MKIRQKQYAESLYQAVQGKDQGEIKELVKNFIKILVRNNDISKTEKILNEFSRIWNLKAGVLEAEVVSARKLDPPILWALNSYLIKLSKAKKIILNNKINKNILGGVIIRFGDKVIDGSLKMSLNELRSKMVK